MPDESAGHIAVLGAGSWGTALAYLLGGAWADVRLWARDAALVCRVESERSNTRYLPGVELPPTVTATESLAAAVPGARAVFFAVPSSAVRQVGMASLQWVMPDTLIISACKGLEERTDQRLTEVLHQVLGGKTSRIVALSGPNLAVEVARGLPTAAVAASNDSRDAAAVQNLFAGVPTYRVYTGTDMLGVELGGAIKNVIAIAAGVCDGLRLGDNSKAALMTRGLTEAVRLGTALGARTETFMGLSGVGDLIATGGSKLSRNYRVGYGLGEGQPLSSILATLGQVAEGVPTTRAIHDLSHRAGVDMPLCNALNAVLFEGRMTPAVIGELLLRPPRNEFD